MEKLNVPPSKTVALIIYSLGSNKPLLQFISCPAPLSTDLEVKHGRSSVSQKAEKLANVMHEPNLPSSYGDANKLFIIFFSNCCKPDMDLPVGSPKQDQGMLALLEEEQGIPVFVNIYDMVDPSYPCL